jgi:hypothetical protein
VIGIFSQAQLAQALRAAAAGKTIHGRSVLIRELRTPDDAAGCEAVIMAGDAGDDGTLKALREKSILTIGDAENFTDAGGIIRFFIEDNKERFEVNTLAAERAHLEISSKLLKLAKIVRK